MRDCDGLTVATCHLAAHDYPVCSVWGVIYGRGVPRPSFPCSIVEFQRRFPDDEACRGYLFDSRWPDGFCCPVCGDGEVGVEHRRHLWQCKRCGHQSSVTSGTVMHKTRTPLRLWFWSAYLVATHTPACPRCSSNASWGSRAMRPLG
jgi:ribosomal protein S27AE